MLEGDYTQDVRSHLPPGVYALKLNLPYTAGVADNWYSGLGGDLWVEYKYYPEMPSTLRLITGKSPKITLLQQDWLRQRSGEGRHVAVVVGSTQGGVILDHLSWDMEEIPVSELITKRAIAAWIAGVCGA